MQNKKKKKGSGFMSKKKTTVLTVDADLVESRIEGGLWGMRLIEHGESVVGLEPIGNKKYAIEVRQTGKELDTKQLSLAFMGKDNP